MFRYPKDVGSLPVKKVINKTREFKEYGCDICSDGGWTSETEVEIHKTKIHYTRVFMKELRKRDDYCFICIKKCKSKEAVIRHIKTEHLLSTETCMRVEREIFICNYCSSIFFNKENLVIHLRYAHLNLKNMFIIRCLICFKNILAKNIPAHFYLHNIQSVSTCRICLMKCGNTKELKEHLKLHPYYLKCDMCYYETKKVESFHNHVLLRHKNNDDKSMKAEPVTGDDNVSKINDDDVDDAMIENDSMTIIEVKDEDGVTGNVTYFNVSKINDDDVDNAMIENDLMTIIEVKDEDGVTGNVTYFNNFMTQDVKGDTTKKKNLKGVKKKKRKIAAESALTVENVMKNAAMTETDNVLTDKDFSTDDDAFSDGNIFTVKVSMTRNDDKDYVMDKFMKSQSMKDEDVITYDSMSESNLMTVEDLSMTNHEDSMTSQESDDNVMTVIEISDSNLETAHGTLTGNVETVKKPAEDFKRFFIPESPVYLRLQRISGLRGIRLSNDVHVCILCREVCVGLEEMRSHIDEHNVKKEERNSYECSCGEQFTNKVLLKHHAFKSKHIIK